MIFYIRTTPQRWSCNLKIMVSKKKPPLPGREPHFQIPCQKTLGILWGRNTSSTQLPIPQSWMICVGKAPGKSHSCHYASRTLQSSVFSLWWTCVLSIQVPLMTFKHSNEKPPFEPCDLLLVFGRLSCQKKEKHVFTTMLLLVHPNTLIIVNLAQANAPGGHPIRHTMSAGWHASYHMARWLWHQEVNMQQNPPIKNDMFIHQKLCVYTYAIRSELHSISPLDKHLGKSSNSFSNMQPEMHARNGPTGLGLWAARKSSALGNFPSQQPMGNQFWLYRGTVKLSQNAVDIFLKLMKGVQITNHSHSTYMFLIICLHTL